MAIDEWNIPTEPTRNLRRDVSDFKNGTNANIEKLSAKVDSMRRDINVLINAINELVGIIKDEVKKSPIKKKRLPRPPMPPRTLRSFER